MRSNLQRFILFIAFSDKFWDDSSSRVILDFSSCRPESLALLTLIEISNLSEGLVWIPSEFAPCRKALSMRKIFPPWLRKAACLLSAVSLLVFDDSFYKHSSWFSLNIFWSQISQDAGCFPCSLGTLRPQQYRLVMQCWSPKTILRVIFYKSWLWEGFLPFYITIYRINNKRL